MDESLSAFGEESPILFKYPRKTYEVRCSGENLNLDELYKDLILYLKKSKNITKQDLKMLSKQVNTMVPEDPKNRWLVKKIKGLIKFILKKRADFQNDIVNGEIVVFEHSKSEPSTSSEVPTSSSSLCNGSDVNIPSSMLTNDDFVSMDVSGNKKIPKVETVDTNYSEDLFGSSTAALHNYGQDNYELLKTLTQNSISNEDFVSLPIVQDETLFKTPLEVNCKIEKVYQVHETLEENYKSIISSIPDDTQVDSPDVAMKTLEEQSICADPQKQINIFDQLSQDREELKNDFKNQLEETGKWVSDLIANLMKLNVKKRHKPKVEKIEDEEKTPSLNNSFTTSSTELRTYYSEENYKIIKETCQQFKKSLETKQFKVPHVKNENESENW